MSVSNVGGASSWWQLQQQPASAASAQAKGRASGNPDATAAGSGASFRQSLPAALQALLAPGSAAPTGAGEPTSQSASTKSSGAPHHQHQPHHQKGGGSDPFTQPSRAFAADVTQAIQVYRAKPPPNPTTSTLA